MGNSDSKLQYRKAVIELTTKSQNIESGRLCKRSRTARKIRSSSKRTNSSVSSVRACSILTRNWKLLWFVDFSFELCAPNDETDAVYLRGGWMEGLLLLGVARVQKREKLLRATSSWSPFEFTYCNFWFYVTDGFLDLDP